MTLQNHREVLLSNVVTKYRSSAMDEILPNLFLGGFSASQNPNNLHVHGIRHIVCCLESEFGNYCSDGFNVLKLQIMDSITTNISEHFSKAIEFIHIARCKGEGVLVHCFAGVSRSATIVAAYLLTVTPLDFLGVLGYLISKRRTVNPNTGFRMQLCKYSKQNLDDRRQALRELVGVERHEELVASDANLTNTSVGPDFNLIKFRISGVIPS